MKKWRMLEAIYELQGSRVTLFRQYRLKISLQNFATGIFKGRMGFNIHKNPLKEAKKIQNPPKYSPSQCEPSELKKAIRPGTVLPHVLYTALARL